MNIEQFHRSVGGRKNHYPGKYAEMNNAPLIRELVVLCRILTGMNNTQIAKNIGVSGGTLSRACYGIAGEKINSDGKSTTQTIVENLQGIVSPKSNDFSI